MKKQFFRMASLCHAAGRSVMVIVMLTVVSICNAQPSQVKQEIKTAPASVKYMGSEDDYRSFLVSYDNFSGDKFEVSVFDHEGGLLYKQMFTDKSFRKMFVLPRQGGTVTFNIKNMKTNETSSFEANTRVVEEMVVKRVS